MCPNHVLLTCHFEGLTWRWQQCRVMWLKPQSGLEIGLQPSENHQLREKNEYSVTGCDCWRLMVTGKMLGKVSVTQAYRPVSDPVGTTCYQVVFPN